MYLAGEARRTPMEVEGLGFFDALAWQAELMEQKRGQMKWEASLVGAEIKW